MTDPFLSGNEAEPDEDNPFDPDDETEEYNEWESGFESAEEERLAEMDDDT